MKYLLIIFKIFIAAIFLNFSWAGQYEVSKSTDLKGNVESEGINLFLWQSFPYYGKHTVYDDPILNDVCEHSCVAISALSLSNIEPLSINISKPEGHNLVYQIAIDILLFGILVSLLFLILLFRFASSFTWVKSTLCCLFKR